MIRLSGRALLLLTVTATSMTLAGCEHMKSAAKADDDSKLTASDSKLSDAIASAAADAQGSGMTSESLMFQSKLYHDDPNDPAKILNYARALRYSGRVDDAILVIRTPAKGPRASEPMMTEAAMILISSGKYDEALEFAQAAVEKNSKSVDAHHALALALSGLGKFSDAQLQFQETIQMWPEGRDQTSVINNLAMSLAAQGKVPEARNVMAMATGEALRSQTYQNNRALLEAIKDRTPVKAETLEPIIAKPVLVHEDVAQPKVEPVVKSQPVAEEKAKPQPRNKRKTTAAAKVKSLPPVEDPVVTVPTPAATKAVSGGGKMAPIVE